MVDGYSPLSTVLVLIWVSSSSHGLPARLSLSHRDLEHRARGDFSSAPPLMAQLYFYCKISITPAVQVPACLLQWFPLPTFATVNGALVLDTLDRPQRKLLAAGLLMIPAEHSFLGFMNFTATGAQRTKTEDSP